MKTRIRSRLLVVTLLIMLVSGVLPCMRVQAADNIKKISTNKEIVDNLESGNDVHLYRFTI